ncbi:hypothetical protein FRB99_008441 [Tulasnella sp. 403]|nr:hypothetical protein FRB99_008441 [Tulasnella sp. 403]
MGHRHQLFFTARIGDRYRALAAFHDQWLFMGEAVVIAHKIILKVLTPHAEMIKRELQCLEDPQYIYCDDLYPAPYLTSAIKTTFENWNPEPCNIDPELISNDTGQTYFDITDPAKPRMCFIDTPDSNGWLTYGEPLDPKSYVLYTYGRDSWRDNIRKEYRDEDDLTGRNTERGSSVELGIDDETGNWDEEYKNDFYTLHELSLTTRRAVCQLWEVPLIKQKVLREVWRAHMFQREETPPPDGDEESTRPRTEETATSQESDTLCPLSLISLRTALATGIESDDPDDAATVARHLVNMQLVDEVLHMAKSRDLPAHATVIIIAAFKHRQEVIEARSGDPELDLRGYMLSADQIFFIARIGRTYRPVANFHHQSLSPSEAIVLAHRILEIGLEPNSDLVQRELACLRRPDYIYRDDGAYPAPYLTSVLERVVCDGWSGYPQPADGDPSERIDNVMNQIIFDITSPATPELCFINRYDGHFHVLYPLTARQYASIGTQDRRGGNLWSEDGYQPEHLNLAICTAITKLNDVPLLQPEILAETWGTQSLAPRHGWLPFWNPANLERPPESIQNTKLTEDGIIPLSLLAFRVALNTAIDSGVRDDAQLVARELINTTMAEEILDMIKSRPLPDTCAPIIASAFTKRQESVEGQCPMLELDLREYNLSSNQVADVLEQIPEQLVDALDLSSRPDITGATLRRTLQSRWRPLKRLILLNNSGVLKSEMDTLEEGGFFIGVNVVYSQWERGDWFTGSM